MFQASKNVNAREFAGNSDLITEYGSEFDDFSSGDESAFASFSQTYSGTEHEFDSESESDSESPSSSVDDDDDSSKKRKKPTSKSASAPVDKSNSST